MSTMTSHRDFFVMSENCHNLRMQKCISTVSNQSSLLVSHATDKNECESDENICGSNSVCSNVAGSYKCHCMGGFESKHEDGKNCYGK